MPIPGVTIRHTIGSVGDIDGLWLLQIGEPVGVGFLRAVVETYVVTSGERTPQPEPDGRAENRAVVTEGVVFSVFAVGIRPRRQGGDEIVKAHEGLKNAICKAYKQGRRIAAICAAPSILGERDC